MLAHVLKARVPQETATSCGIASVATVAKRIHRRVMNEARKLFAWGDERRSFYTSFSQLRILLSAFGLHAGRKRESSDWSVVPALAIAAINHRIKDEVEYWHWVVVQRVDGDLIVFDPRSKRARRTDLGRMRLHSYMTIKVEP